MVGMVGIVLGEGIGGGQRLEVHVLLLLALSLVNLLLVLVNLVSLVATLPHTGPGGAAPILVGAVDALDINGTERQHHPWAVPSSPIVLLLLLFDATIATTNTNSTTAAGQLPSAGQNVVRYCRVALQPPDLVCRPSPCCSPCPSCYRQSVSSTKIAGTDPGQRGRVGPVAGVGAATVPAFPSAATAGAATANATAATGATAATANATAGAISTRGAGGPTDGGQ
mmetsp:Transcript_3871/g.8841  ORF Transcript_3871/g.8841 Transcript_3871/m.8841 type:complete len:225 (-) Transcript_3871:141-815(-)